MSARIDHSQLVNIVLACPWIVFNNHSKLHKVLKDEYPPVFKPETYVQWGRLFLIDLDTSNNEVYNPLKNYVFRINHSVVKDYEALKKPDLAIGWFLKENVYKGRGLSSDLYNGGWILFLVEVKENLSNNKEFLAKTQLRNGVELFKNKKLAELVDIGLNNDFKHQELRSKNQAGQGFKNYALLEKRLEMYPLQRIYAVAVSGHVRKSWLLAKTKAEISADNKLRERLKTISYKTISLPEFWLEPMLNDVFQDQKNWKKKKLELFIKLLYAEIGFLHIDQRVLTPSQPEYWVEIYS
ncbi:hypothetical protein J7L02_00105 [Candidatus Woesearchaeota archaeon]|nr:hypothetical protein [Candidatus Woesearchaeota archaeon]